MEHRRSLRIDREQLAWAAGFFDGEGSTFAKSDRDRPDYHQLGIAVPQAGLQVPEALVRFRAAMLGMGRIDPPSKGGPHKWRARGFVDAQQTVVLLWPYIGQVKRQQAAAAMLTVARQYTPSFRARAPKTNPVLVEHRLARPSDSGRLERAWAAGFLDAEGCFGLARTTPRADGSAWYRIRISASQHGSVGKPPEVLFRLKAALGGMGRIERHGDPDDFKWTAEGIAAARQVLATVGPWLGSVKRAQAHDVMDDFLDQPRMSGPNDHCNRGHLYERRVVLATGRSRPYCKACARMIGRIARAKKGIAPRQFQNARRRYTD
jgi:hypothetical protein